MTQKEIQDITDALDFAGTYISYVKLVDPELHGAADAETAYLVSKARKHMNSYDSRLIEYRKNQTKL